MARDSAGNGIRPGAESRHGTEAALTAAHERDGAGSERAVPSLLPPRQAFSAVTRSGRWRGLTKGRRPKTPPPQPFKIWTRIYVQSLISKGARCAVSAPLPAISSLAFFGRRPLQRGEGLVTAGGQTYTLLDVRPATERVARMCAASQTAEPAGRVLPSGCFHDAGPTVASFDCHNQSERINEYRRGT
jgi:hypothetical protein